QLGVGARPPRAARRPVPLAAAAAPKGAELARPLRRSTGAVRRMPWRAGRVRGPRPVRLPALPAPRPPANEGTTGKCMSDEGTIVYRIDRGDVIAEVGGAWLAFALANYAPELAPEKVVGRPLWDFVVGPTTRQLYRDLLARARSGRAARFPFRCDGPA